MIGPIPGQIRQQNRKAVCCPHLREISAAVGTTEMLLTLGSQLGLPLVLELLVTGTLRRVLEPTVLEVLFLLFVGQR
jgi:hypothetical protein